ncbi:VOC family protein [Brachybacterium sp.]|uniref:VOC family protein n=1 Tax=Brachybacterium sp. TaxID=1891286 RepID=UPI002ED24B29
MSLFVSHTTVDCHDAYGLSEWWRAALGYTSDPEDPNLPGHEECAIFDRDTGHTLLFLQVPDQELPAKRIHFDVRPRERTQDEEIHWLTQHGAVPLADHRGKHGPGTGWLTMADPEGNQFCVLRSEAEVADADRVASDGGTLGEDVLGGGPSPVGPKATEAPTTNPQGPLM